MNIVKGNSNKRIMAALLVISMLLTMMPLQAFADDNTIYFVGTFKDTSAVFEVHETSVTVRIDQNTMKATVTFDRTKCEIKSYYLNNNEYNKMVKNAKDVKGVKSGEITCTAKKEAAGSPYMFRLYDFVWESKPYPVSVGKYPASNMTLSTNYYYGKIYTLEKDELNMTEAELEKDHPYGLDYVNLSFQKTTPPAAPAAEEKYIFGEDSYSFLNTASSFVTTVSSDTAGPGLAYNASNGYFLSPEYYSKLISGASNSEIASINNDMRMSWRGNCLGMSVTNNLFYAEELKLSQVDASAKNAYALSKPVSNTALRDAIVYYQLLGNWDKFLDATQATWDATNSVNAQALIKALEKNLPQPVVVYVAGDDWAHAMLAYDMEGALPEYQVKLYDPNDHLKPVTMQITKLGDLYVTSYSNVHYSGTEISGISPLGDGIFTSGAFKAALKPAKIISSSGEALITSSDNNITIKSGEKEAVFENGQKTSGTLDASYCGPLNDIDEKTRVAFKIKLADNSPVNIQTEKGAEITLELPKPNQGGSGAFVVAILENAAETTFDPVTNQVEIAGKSTGEIEVNVASNATTGELFITTVKTSDKGVTVTPSSNGAQVDTASGSTADITVSGAKKSITFEDVKTTTPVEIKNSGNLSTLEANGKVIVSGTASEQGGKAAEKNDITAGNTSFRDISQNAWYAKNVRAVAEAGIVNGKVEGVFAPNDNVTLAEVVKLAATVHAKFTKSNYDFSGGSPWYQPYLDYLNQTESFPDLTGYNFNAPANRELFANVMAGVLSAMSESERSRNNIADDAIPDVSSNDVSMGIYSLYRAGIVAGSDTRGTYNPYSNIKRSEVAAIIHRFIDAKQRKNITLTTTEPLVEQSHEKQTVQSAEADLTGYVPYGWSWSANSEQGKGLNTFTFGKYVRRDGSAVLYICSANDPLCFNYYIYAMPDGSKSSAYTHESRGTLSSSTQAVNLSEGISFTADGAQISVSTSWPTEKYISFGAPDGEFTLVKAQE